jgi:Holliday junction DNA helicase RuvA
MIARITGVLDSVGGLSAHLALSGGEVVHEVMVPAYLAPSLLGRVGHSVTFHTLEYLESHNQGASFVPRLIGFERAVDREFFELLTTVKGIGNRKALRALAEEPRTIARAIASRDAKALQRLPEIGKRLAETVIAELVGKVDRFAEPGGPLGEAKPPAAPLAGPAEEAVAALIALGEHRPEAEARVRAAVERGRGASAEDLVAAALGG